MTRSYSSDPRSYDAAAEYLGNKTDRPIANNTRIIRRDDETIALRLHNTDIILWRADGSAELRADGWQTVTTKDRLNRFSPVGDDGYSARYPIASDRGRWMVYDRQGRMVDVNSGATWPRWRPVCRFYDGLTIAADGRITNAPSADVVAAAETAERAKLADIRRYVKAYMAELLGGRLPVPSGGDCWFCALFPDGAGTDHLESHMAERYYVPSLAVKAMRARGFADAGIAIHLGLSADSDTMRPFVRDGATVSRALTRYLKAALLPSLAR
jgi:hypothetical protein